MLYFFQEYPQKIIHLFQSLILFIGRFDHYTIRCTHFLQTIDLLKRMIHVLIVLIVLVDEFL